MKTNFLTMLVLISIILLSSCNDNLDENQISVSNDEEMSLVQSTTILSFEDEAAFLDAVEKLRDSSNPASNLTRSASENDFYSLYREFDQAMEEADNFYQRDGGYEEFKQKFPNLYYPEYNDDYSAYLPVSDEAIAMLVNPQGKVMINGIERDMRDIFSYERLQELELAIPDDAETVSLRALPINRVIDPSIPYYKAFTEEKVNFTSKRKMWVTLRGVKHDAPNHLAYAGQLKEARIDVCFRKKGKLGWYNGKLYGYPFFIDKDKKKYILDRKYEYSPMRFTAMVEFNSRIHEFPDNSPLDLYIRFESDQKDHDFTAVYPANVKQILLLNNGVGGWEKVKGTFKDALIKLGFSYGSKYVIDWWNEL